MRNGRDGYEFKGDCGLQSIVVETDKEITVGLDEAQSQSVLKNLRPRIEKAARLKHAEGHAYPESPRPGKERFRIALTVADLDAVED